MTADGASDNVGQNNSEEAVTPQVREYEINRIVEGGVDEVFSDWHLRTKSEMLEVYKSLASLVHPDWQTDDVWKQKANQAQQCKSIEFSKSSQTKHSTVLNEARAKFERGPVSRLETIEMNPGAPHRAIWDLPRFVATVRRLHIEPDHPTAVAIASATNEKIEKINADHGFPKDCGKFPLRYLQLNYRNTHNMLKQFTGSIDVEHKARASVAFKSLSKATKDFCRDRKLPSTWAWECEEIDRLPEYLNEYGSSENQAGLISHSENATDAGMEDSGADETILYKRKVFKRIQYLVKETSGLHVWKAADECDDVNADQIPPIMKPTRSFVRERKRQYKDNVDRHAGG